MALRAADSERVAGLAFLAFTLLQVRVQGVAECRWETQDCSRCALTRLSHPPQKRPPTKNNCQVPFFAMRNTAISGWPSLVQLSPLQVMCGKLAGQYPEAAPALETALLPGTWFRESLGPLLRCKMETGGGACEREQRLLLDVGRLRRRAQLASLTKLIQSSDFARGGDALVYGSTLVTLSAALAAVFTVRTAVVGFLLIAAGIYQGGHEPLPPGLLVAFLCVYSGFSLGGERGRLRRAGGRQRGAPVAAEASGAGGSGSGAAKPSASAAAQVS